MVAPNPSDPLSRVLTGWRVAPQRTARFRALVRARLAGAVELPWSTYARRHRAGVMGAVAAALVLGAAGGQGMVRSRAAAHSAQLAAAYVQGLDARTMALR